MNKDLIVLRDMLQKERERLLDKLKQIDGDLASIGRVLDLMERRKSEGHDIQLRLIENQDKSEKLAGLTFTQALVTLFDENPGKYWAPKEITSELLNNGFQTKSKDFGATVRTMLALIRSKNEIGAMRIKGGWLYGQKKKDSVSTVDLDTESKIAGDVSEGTKESDL